MEHPAAGPGGHVIVHGLEGLGLRVVEHFVALGLEVVAVDDGARPGAVQAATALGATVVPHHDGAAAALGAAGLRDGEPSSACPRPTSERWRPRSSPAGSALS